MAALGLSGQLHVRFLEDGRQRPHPVIHVVLGVPYVNDVQNITDYPCRVALSALRVAQTLLVYPCHAVTYASRASFLGVFTM